MTRFKPGDEVTYQGLGDLWYTVEEVDDSRIHTYIMFENDIMMKVKGNKHFIDHGDEQPDRMVYNVQIRNRLKG